jgi:hypothetical protein
VSVFLNKKCACDDIFIIAEFNVRNHTRETLKVCKNLYWYFIALIKRDRIGIGILLVYTMPIPASILTN